MTTMMTERRRHKRADVEEITASYKIFSKANHTYTQASVKNISVGGLNMLLSEQTNKGDLIKVEIPFNNRKNEPIKAFCEVVWFKKQDCSDQYSTGLNFISLKDKDERYLKNYIDNIIKNKHDLYKKL